MLQSIPEGRLGFECDEPPARRTDSKGGTYPAWDQAPAPSRPDCITQTGEEAGGRGNCTMIPQLEAVARCTI